MTTYAHEEIVGLDVSVYKVLAVNKLNSPDHLVGEHQHGLYREPSRAEGE